MRTTFIFSILSLFALSVFGQKIEFVTTPPDTVYGFQTRNELNMEVFVRNPHNKPIDVFLIKNEKFLSPGSESGFCFLGGCYDPIVGKSDVVPLLANSSKEVENLLKAQYFTGKKVGHGVVEYIIVDTTHNDTLKHELVFMAEYDPNTSTSKSNQNFHNKINISNSSIQFTNDFQDPVQLEIINLIGETVFRNSIEPNSSETHKLEHLRAGVYIVRFRIRDQVSVEKFWIE